MVLAVVFMTILMKIFGPNELPCGSLRQQREHPLDVPAHGHQMPFALGFFQPFWLFTY